MNLLTGGLLVRIQPEEPIPRGPFRAHGVTVHSEDIGDTEPGMLAAVLYNRKAGIEPALQFLARGSVYRRPPVLFAIHAPPGRDRLGDAP